MQGWQLQALSTASGLKWSKRRGLHNTRSQGTTFYDDYICEINWKLLTLSKLLGLKDRFAEAGWPENWAKKIWLILTVLATKRWCALNPPSLWTNGFLYGPARLTQWDKRFGVLCGSKVTSRHRGLRSQNTQSWVQPHRGASWCILQNNTCLLIPKVLAKADVWRAVKRGSKAEWAWIDFVSERAESKAGTANGCRHEVLGAVRDFKGSCLSLRHGYWF